MIYSYTMHHPQVAAYLAASPTPCFAVLVCSFLRRLHRHIRYLDVFEIVLADRHEGICVDTSSDSHQGETGKGVLEEVGPAGADKSWRLGQLLVVV